MNLQNHTQSFTKTISFHLKGLASEPSLYLGEGINHIQLKGGTQK